MKRVILLLLLLAFALVCSAETRFGSDTAAIEAACDSVFRIEVFNKKDEKTGSGSAFAYGDGLLITARHVLVNMEYAVITDDSGNRYRVEQLIDADEASDVAVCLMPSGCEAVPLEGDRTYPPRGEAVTAIGSQFGVLNLVSMGNVSGIWKAAEADFILFTAPVSGGNSGGPLLDSKGHVIGVVIGTYEKGQNLNVASPLEYVHNLYPFIKVEGGNAQ